MRKNINICDANADIMREKILTIAGTHMMDELRVAFLILDSNAIIIGIAGPIVDCYGLSKEQLMNSTEREKLNGLPPSYYFGEHTLKYGVPFDNHPVTWKVNGENKNFVVNSMLIKDEQNNIIGCSVAIKDITNIKFLELQIQHNERLAMIGQIAAGIAHEIRNPVTSIRGFLQFLQKSLNNNNMKRELAYTEVMINELDRINDLLNDFLFLSKPRDLTMEQCASNEIIEMMKPIIASEALLANIDISYVLDKSYNIRVDRELIKQVFLNIVHNAIEAMGDNGHLYISTFYEEQDKHIKFNFKDTGPGIPAYVIDKVFDPFFTTKNNGTGLGLAVCQKIINDMGGRMRVISKGYGTTFSIALPVNNDTK